MHLLVISKRDIVNIIMTARCITVCGQHWLNYIRETNVWIAGRSDVAAGRFFTSCCGYQQKKKIAGNRILSMDEIMLFHWRNCYFIITKWLIDSRWNKAKKESASEIEADSTILDWVFILDIVLQLKTSVDGKSESKIALFNYTVIFSHLFNIG
jgi:hypothetical protein